MNCPVCENANLVMSERQGIEVDYCPQCRGVWLDRGELDKIIERAATDVSRVTPAPPERHRAPRYDYDDHKDHYRKKKKRGGFLGELFDFD